MIEKSNYSVVDLFEIINKDLQHLLIMNETEEETEQNIKKTELYLKDLLNMVRDRNWGK